MRTQLDFSPFFFNIPVAHWYRDTWNGGKGGGLAGNILLDKMDFEPVVTINWFY